MPTNLTIATGLTATPQRVQDAAGANSALSISTQEARLERTTPGILLTTVAPKENGTSPSVVIHSHSREASIRMTAANTTTGKIPNAFHVGTLVPGTGAEDKAVFFIWSDVNGIAVEVDANGNVTAQRDVTVRGSLSAPGIPAADPSRAASLKAVMIDPNTGTLFHL